MMQGQQSTMIHHNGGPPPPLRVLVVEDDPMLRRVLVRILRSWGHQIVEAPDGQAALDQIDAHGNQLDLVLLDMMLPGIDGLQVARRVGAERPELPIVACSAVLNERLLEQLRQAGVCHALPKPFTADHLRSTIEWVAGGH